RREDRVHAAVRRHDAAGHSRHHRTGRCDPRRRRGGAAFWRRHLGGLAGNQVMSARSLVLALLVVVTTAAAAGSPKEAHGSADVYAAPGVALAWGTLRGPSEAATSVIIRIVADPKV